MTRHILFSTFYQNNLIDRLLGEFKLNFNWDINEIESDYHKYHWCNIILTEEIKSDVNWDSEFPFEIDLLGEYSKNEIKLFILMIEKYAINICENKKERKNLIEKLSYIVLIHEMVHWIIYTIKDHKMRVFTSTTDNGIDKTNFHEGLAQYFTWYIIQKDTELLEVFEKLNQNQPSEYKVFEVLKDKDISDIMIAISVSRNEKRQSWEFLKLVIKISEFLKKDESNYFKRLDKMINPKKYKSNLLNDDDANKIIDKYDKIDINSAFRDQFYTSVFLEVKRGHCAGKKYGF